MDIFDVLSMLGGLCLFLFGMNLMGEALERCRALTAEMADEAAKTLHNGVSFLNGYTDALAAAVKAGEDRTDHCSNLAGCVIDLYHHDMNTHETLRAARVENRKFGEQYKAYAGKYSLS